MFRKKLVVALLSVAALGAVAAPLNASAATVSTTGSVTGPVSNSWHCC